jgi:hypothetical protein
VECTAVRIGQAALSSFKRRALKRNSTSSHLRDFREVPKLWMFQKPVLVARALRMLTGCQFLALFGRSLNQLSRRDCE